MESKGKKGAKERELGFSNEFKEFLKNSESAER